MMIEITEQLENPQAGEEPTETYVRLQNTLKASPIGGERTVPARDTVPDPVVNELMIRRIMSALTAVE
jgi:hypothetical protein